VRCFNDHQDYCTAIGRRLRCARACVVAHPAVLCKTRPWRATTRVSSRKRLHPARVSVLLSIFLIKSHELFPSIERRDGGASSLRRQRGNFGDTDVDALTARTVTLALMTQRAALRGEHDNNGRAEEVCVRLVHFTVDTTPAVPHAAATCSAKRKKARGVHLQLSSGIVVFSASSALTCKTYTTLRRSS